MVANRSSRAENRLDLGHDALIGIDAGPLSRIAIRAGVQRLRKQIDNDKRNSPWP
jgi:hypothetical protein